jgi:phosphatidylglycerol---prolipoprotein diacylglyceryl transferase
MRPEIDVLGLPIKTFGLIFALAFLACGLVCARRLRELGKPVDWAYEIAFAALVGGIVGSRLYWIVQHYDQAKGDLVGTLFSGSGLVWYGGAIGGAIGVVAWAWVRGFLGLALLDLCATPLALGYAVGRAGCQVSGDGDYGDPSGLPWAMAYPDGAVPTTREVHPSPIYESLAMGLVALWLWHKRDVYRPGVLFAFYLVLSGLERFLVEFVRRNQVTAVGLTVPAIESLVLAVAGAAWLLLAHRRGGLARAGTSGGVPAAA